MTATFAAAQAARPLPEVHVSRRAVTAAAVVAAAVATYVVFPAFAIAVALLVGPAVALSFVARQAGAFEDFDTVLIYSGNPGGVR